MYRLLPLSHEARIYYISKSLSRAKSGAAGGVGLTLSVFLCRSLGGAAVAVHPGLQGDVQAFPGGASEERLGRV